LDGGRKLSRKARAAIENPDNDIFVSAASAWEIALKKSIGKLSVPDNLEEELDSHQFEKLFIHFSHVTELQKLPPVHRDPFDRMLIAQSRVENLVIVTRDPGFLNYPIQVLEA
jgi:PIN domain nuclease of toxin-antitoxin system